MAHLIAPRAFAQFPAIRSCPPRTAGRFDWRSRDAQTQAPIKELETVLREAEDQNWRVDKGSKYYSMCCPCGLKHYKWVHLTPSSANYERKLRTYLKNYTCWKEGT